MSVFDWFRRRQSPLNEPEPPPEPPWYATVTFVTPRQPVVVGPFRTRYEAQRRAEGFCWHGFWDGDTLTSARQVTSVRVSQRFDGDPASERGGSTFVDLRSQADA